MFDIKKFEELFLASLDMVTNSEAVTKRELRNLSRTVLEATHETGNIGYVNKLVEVLSPANKKVARIFFTHFTGFHFDEASLIFTKKSGKRYMDAKAASLEFLADPHQNIWTWTDRHVEIVPKPFSADKLVTYMTGQIKKAGDKRAVLRAVLGMDAFSADDIMAVLEAMGNKAEKKPA